MIGWLFIAAIGYGLAAFLILAALMGFSMWGKEPAGSEKETPYLLASLACLMLSATAAMTTDLLLGLYR